MKKIILKSLALKKNSISNLTRFQAKGGSQGYPTFDASCTCQIDTENCSTVDVWRRCEPCSY